MKTRICFSEIACIRPGSEVTIFDGKPSKIPPIIVEVKNLKEFVAHRDDYVRQATESGLCGRIYSYKLGADRAVPGFLQVGNVLVNKHVGEAAPLQ